VLFRINSEAELRDTFRRRDEGHVDLPPQMTFPVSFRHYVAWHEPSGVRQFLVLQRPQWARPIGIVFRRYQTPGPGSGSGTGTGMCEWCHAHGASDEIGLLSADVDSKRRVGVNLCLDLSCQEKLESLPGIPPTKIKELTEKLMRRMTRFVTDALEIQPQISATPPKQ
jgi:hypothetical protein